MKQAIQIQTPGRVCLFGDHQDYLGLPVIACAINRFVIISAETNATDNFIIEMPDIGEQRIIPVTPQTEALEPGDHWASVLKVVRRYGCAPNKGYTLQVRSTVPINAGVSSSSAVVVAWTQFLLETFGCEHPISQDLIARIAYEAEVVEHNSPGGNMDQYSVSVGGVLHIQTGDEFSFEKLHTELPNLVLGVSGIPKQTIGLLGDLRGKATTAISAIKKSDPSFNLTTAVVTDLPALYPMVEASLHPYLEAAIRNHDITQKALTEMRAKSLDATWLGSLMTAHHEVLRDLLSITVPRIDQMIEAALNAGAFGAKIVGSGGGGSIVALSPPDRSNQLCEAIKKAGAIDAFEVSVAQGSKRIRS